MATSAVSVSARFHWRAFAPLALLRVFAAAYALAMVHPDEFFQSQEVMARDVLSEQDPTLAGQLHTPWEFALPSPNRSVLFPYLVAGIPYKLLQLLGVPLSGRVLLLVPRLLLCALSFLIDASLFHSAKALHVEKPMAVVFSFASSWPALIFLTRPFSNTMETLVLALSMGTLLCVNSHHRFFFKTLHTQTLFMGSLLALGVFTRFTFPFFFFPLGLELVRRQDALVVQQFKKQHDSEEVPVRNGAIKSSPVSKVSRHTVEKKHDETTVAERNGVTKSVSKLALFKQQFEKKTEVSVAAAGTKTSWSVPKVSRLVQQEYDKENEAYVAAAVEKQEAKKKAAKDAADLLATKEAHEYTKTNGASDAEPDKSQATSLLKRRIARAISVGVQGLVSFCVWSIAIIALDTWYFHGELALTTEAWTTTTTSVNIVIAPWNNLKYNLDPANLELHGTHPRATHALVNMPMLFGPLFVVFLFNLKTAKQRVWQVSCVLVPLTLLSLAPHQEPRFLLPLLVPLHLFHGDAVKDTRWKKLLWGVFSAVLALFFGVLHQGGLLPLLLALSSGGSSSSMLLTLPFTGCRFIDDLPPLNNMPIVFYKTYMPPRFALANSAEPWGSYLRVVDLAGGDAMATQLYEHGLASYSELLLVAPASVEIDKVVAALATGAADNTKPPPVVGTCFPHVSTENLDWGKPMELVIYRWSKPSFVSRLWEATTAVFSS